MEQPAGLMKAMNASLNAYTAIAEMKQAKKAGGETWVKWQMNNPQTFKEIMEIAKYEQSNH